MPAPVPNSDVFELRYSIDSPIDGFGEHHWIPTTDPAVARTYAKEILKARSYLLAKDFSIVRASLSRYEIFKDSLTPGAYPAIPVLLAAATDAGGVIDDCNNTGVGIEFRFITTSGHRRNMILRGVRDGWIKGNKEVSALLPAPNDAEVAPYITSITAVSATTTSAAVLKNYLSLVRDLTCHVRSNPLYPITDPSNKYLLETWNKFVYRFVGQHDTGEIKGATRGRKPAFA